MIIEANNVSFSFDDDSHAHVEKVLTDINLKIEKGSFVAILGRNGSGKSTLAKHFNAILLPSGGSVQVFGMDTRFLGRSRNFRWEGEDGQIAVGF